MFQISLQPQRPDLRVNQATVNWQKQRKQNTKKQQQKLCPLYLYIVDSDFCVFSFCLQFKLNVEHCNLGLGVRLGLHLKASIAECLLKGYSSHQLWILHNGQWQLLESLLNHCSSDSPPNVWLEQVFQLLSLYIHLNSLRKTSVVTNRTILSHNQTEFLSIPFYFLFYKASKVGKDFKL